MVYSYGRHNSHLGGLSEITLAPIMELDAAGTPGATTTVGTDFWGEGNFTHSDLNVNGTTPMNFIFSPLAFTISGVFVWSALLLTCFQVRLEMV